MAVVEYRLKNVERVQGRLHERVNEHESELTTLREQVAGEGGLQKAVHSVREEIGSLRTAFYALTASLVLATVGLAGAIISHAL